MGELMTTETTETETTAFSEYDAQLADLVARQATFAGDYLQWHYHVGVLANQMADAASQGGILSTYGEKVVKHVADRLHRREREVYACIQLARRLSQEEIDEFKEAPRPWPLRGITALLTVADTEAFKEFKKKYEDRNFGTTDDLRKAITEHNQGRRASTKKAKAKKSAHTGRQARAQIKRMSVDLTHLAKQAVPECIKGIHDYTKYGSRYYPEMVAEVEEAMKEARKRIDSLGKCLAKTRAEIDDALAKEVKCEVA